METTRFGTLLNLLESLECGAAWMRRWTTAALNGWMGNAASAWTQAAKAMHSLRSLSRVLGVILMLVLALGPAGSPAVAQAQAELLQAAALTPGQTVRVIVQKSGVGTTAEEEAARLGGAVQRDLSIINAFVAEMSAGAAVELAASPAVRWVSLDSVVRQSTASAQFTTWATAIGTSSPNNFGNSGQVVDSALGPNGTFASLTSGKGALSGFSAEVTPGQAISKVEVAVRLYSLLVPTVTQDPVISIVANGVSGKTVTLNHSSFLFCSGVLSPCTLYIDVTNTRTWKWADFGLPLEVTIDQSRFLLPLTIHYDAVGLRVTSTNGTDVAPDSGGDPSAQAAIDGSQQVNIYNQVIGATQLWNSGSKLQGKGITVAVADSGITRTKDLDRRVRANINFDLSAHDSIDRFGHGTFVAGLVAGSGAMSAKKYMGVAPRADLLNVRLSNDVGMANESDVIVALQWILQNKARYNIRVVNLSLNSAAAQSYLTSPLDAACEILWFNGIVVVVSAGNNGSTTLFPPANDPFVITVGATDDKGTATLNDDLVAGFSAYGVTEDGFAKPDLVVPGKNIIGLLPDNDRLNMSNDHAANRIDKTYFKMSGTSVAAPIVSGAIALLLQDEPNLTPDQVKYRLLATANTSWTGYDPARAGAGYLDINAAVKGNTRESANTGIIVSSLLTTGPEPVNSSVSWNSVSWNSVSWNSVSWNSVSWNSVSWNSVSWNSDYWGQ